MQSSMNSSSVKVVVIAEPGTRVIAGAVYPGTFSQSAGSDRSRASQLGATLANQPRQLMANRTEKRVVRRHAALELVVALKELAHRIGALAVPLLAHVAVVALLRENGEHVLAIDDLGVKVDSEKARHDAVAIARELHHRERVVRRFAIRAQFVSDRREAIELRARNEIEETIVDDAKMPVIGQQRRHSAEE